MTCFFDTSVLVPVFYGDHEHHQASIDLFADCDPSTGCCATHSLAEVYATLTRMPGKHRISGDQAMLFINNIREHLEVVSLDEHDYREALERCARVGIVGGTTYDAMLAQCALKNNASTLYTWNLRHYRLVGPDIEGIVRTP